MQVKRHLARLTRRQSGWTWQPLHGPKWQANLWAIKIFARWAGLCSKGEKKKGKKDCAQTRQGLCSLSCSSPPSLHVTISFLPFMGRRCDFIVVQFHCSVLFRYAEKTDCRTFSFTTMLHITSCCKHYDQSWVTSFKACYILEQKGV